jgi:geranylgeranyl transferase type-2 subunit beta
MGPEPYLQRLTARLVDGLDRLSEAFRARHAAWLRANQNPDGGFSGREGGSDLYYTGFALRGLAVLQGLTPEISTRAAGYLRQRMSESASVIDLFSLLVSCVLVQIGGGPDVLADSPADWPDRVAATLETFRTPDGGYAKAAGATSGSTYHSFLVALTLQLLDRPIPQPDQLVTFVRGRRREDGGYVEAPAMRRSGTNPTAAGVGILQLTGALDATEREAAASFLLKLPSPLEGGFRANDRIPTADLLSTFTGAWTLAQLDALEQLDAHAVFSYAQALEVKSGGFRGGLWDNVTDVEYTFYGLGVFGLLATEGAKPPGGGPAEQA